MDWLIQVGLVGHVAVFPAAWVAWLVSSLSIELSSLPHASVFHPRLKGQWLLGAHSSHGRWL